MEQTALIKRRLLDLLVQLEASPWDCLTIYLSPVSLARFPGEAPVESGHKEIEEALSARAVVREAGRWRTGAVIFWSKSESGYIVLPPFPVPEDRFSRGRPETLPLRQLLEKERSLGVVLVTWGSYAIGVVQNDNLVECKTGTGYIHKQHRKGGRSQKRFARRTEEQKKDFLAKVVNRIEEQFRGYPVEEVFFGGNRLLFQPLREQCPYLMSQVQRISMRFLNVRHADREALLRSSEELSKSLVFSYRRAPADTGQSQEKG